MESFWNKLYFTALQKQLAFPDNDCRLIDSDMVFQASSSKKYEIYLF